MRSGEWAEQVDLPDSRRQMGAHVLSPPRSLMGSVERLWGDMGGMVEMW